MKKIKYVTSAIAFTASLFAAGLAHAEQTAVVGYQQIVGPFITAIADGRFDAAAKEAGYTIDCASSRPAAISPRHSHPAMCRSASSARPA